ncbi:MAG: HAD family hydrolase [SAR324 cluster bacterium]|nr:HAD family hydrolase [SAR324 cluster bacterium]
MAPIPILKRNFWVFDLDGTLTVPVHDFSAIRKTLGISSAKQGILESLAAMPQEKARVLYDKLDRIEIELARKTKPALGLFSVLSTLNQRDCQLGILTRNTQQNAWLSLQAMQVESFFEKETVLGRENASPKPDPGGVLKLSDHWKSSPEEMVMVGDYLFDLQAGRAAGTATIHVDRTSTFPWPEWMDLGVTTLLELSEKLEQN